MAPSASRVAISLRRAEARASSRLATFEHAISSTSSVAPRPSAEPKTIWLRGTQLGLSNWVRAEMTVAPVMRMAPVSCSPIRFTNAAVRSCACASDIPAGIRPIGNSQRMARCSSTPSLPGMVCACIMSGTQISAQ